MLAQSILYRRFKNSIEAHFNFAANGLRQMGHAVVEHLDVHRGYVHHDAAPQCRENVPPHCYLIRSRISGGRDVRLLIDVQPAGSPTAQGEYVGLFLWCAMAFQPVLCPSLCLGFGTAIKGLFNRGIIRFKSYCRRNSSQFFLHRRCPPQWFFTIIQGARLWC